MSDNKKIQKVTKLTLKTLTNENTLAVRGLKDLQLLNTPRLLYLAGLYNECIDLCVEMKNGIEAPEPEDPEERQKYILYGPTIYIKEPTELTKEDYWYWNLSLQKVGRFFVTDKEHEEGDRNYNEKSWAYPILLSFVGLDECMQLFEQRLKDGLICNADYWYYAVCLQEMGETDDAIEYFIKSTTEKIQSQIFRESGLEELGKLYFKIGQYKKAEELLEIKELGKLYFESKNYVDAKRCYLNYFENDIFTKTDFLNKKIGRWHSQEGINLVECFYALKDFEKAFYYLNFIKNHHLKAEFLESKKYLKEALQEWILALEESKSGNNYPGVNKKIENKISSILKQINLERNKI